MDPARVRTARLQAGLSLAQLAGDDVSRTFIHFVETGKSRPSRRILALIARRTGKPISYFIGKTGRSVNRHHDLPAELTTAADHIRAFVNAESLNEVESNSMRLIELTLRQAARVTGAIQRQSDRVASSL